MKLTRLFHEHYLPHARRVLKPKTVEEYKRLFTKTIEPKFGDTEAGRIMLAAVEKWHAGVPGKVQANRAVALLSGIFTYALEREMVAKNPCHRFKSRNAEKAKEFFYTPEQSEAILTVSLTFPDIRGRYIALELLTGCRPNELRDVAASWRTPGAIRTPDHKGRRNHIVSGRTIYLSPPAEAILDSLSAIHAREGNPAARCYFPQDMDLRRAWERIVKAAGVPKARQYDLRHTFASAALASGKVTLDVVGLLLGQRKRETTLRYAHLAPDIGVNAATAAAERMRPGK